MLQAIFIFTIQKKAEPNHLNMIYDPAFYQTNTISLAYYFLSSAMATTTTMSAATATAMKSTTA